MIRLPAELLDDVFCIVAHDDGIDIAKVPEPRDGRLVMVKPSTRDLCNLRRTCKAFAFIAARHLFRRRPIIVTPSRLRQFVHISGMYIAGSINICTFHADTALARMPPVLATVNLMALAIKSLTELTELTSLDLWFYEIGYERAPGDWIDHRPRLVATVLTCGGLTNLTSLTVRMTAEEFVALNTILNMTDKSFQQTSRSSRALLSRLTSFSLSLSFIQAARYGRIPGYGGSTPQYIPETLFTNTQALEKALTRFLCGASQQVERLAVSFLQPAMVDAAVLDSLWAPRLTHLVLTRVGVEQPAALVALLDRHAGTLNTGAFALVWAPEWICRQLLERGDDFVPILHICVGHDNFSPEDRSTIDQFRMRMRARYNAQMPHTDTDYYEEACEVCGEAIGGNWRVGSK